jgi:hypothetical protein
VGGDEAPGPLLVEQRIASPQQPLYARRVSADGRLWEHSGVRMVVEEGAEPRFEEQEPRWRPRWRLRAEDMDALRAAVRASGFMDLAAELVAEGEVSDPREITWAAELDGRRHEVVLRGAPFVTAPEIERLERDVNAVLQRAADAARQAGEEPG